MRKLRHGEVKDTPEVTVPRMDGLLSYAPLALLALGTYVSQVCTGGVQLQTTHPRDGFSLMGADGVAVPRNKGESLYPQGSLVQWGWPMERPGNLSWVTLVEGGVQQHPSAPTSVSPHPLISRKTHRQQTAERPRDTQGSHLSLPHS